MSSPTAVTVSLIPDGTAGADLSTVTALKNCMTPILIRASDGMKVKEAIVS